MKIFWPFDDRATTQITDRDWVSPQKDPHIYTDTEVRTVRTVFGASKLRRELPTNSRRFALGRRHTTYSQYSPECFAVIVIISLMRAEGMTGDIRFTSE